MKLHERVINVLSCKHVDDVIIGAPWTVSNDLITTFNIKVVVNVVHNDKDETPLFDTSTCFDIPKKRGILRQLCLKNNFTMHRLVRRIIDNRQSYVERNKNRAKKELDYLSKEEVVFVAATIYLYMYGRVRKK